MVSSNFLQGLEYSGEDKDGGACCKHQAEGKSNHDQHIGSVQMEL